MKAKMLTITEAAELLNCHKNTVRVLITKGQLTALRLQRSFRIPLESVNDLIFDATEGGEVITRKKLRRY